MVLQEVLAHLKMLSGRRRCTPSVLVIPYATHSMKQACMLKLSRICLAFPAPHWGFRALPGVHQRRPPPGRPGWIRNPENLNLGNLPWQDWASHPTLWFEATLFYLWAKHCSKEMAVLWFHVFFLFKQLKHTIVWNTTSA